MKRIFFLSIYLISLSLFFVACDKDSVETDKPDMFESNEQYAKDVKILTSDKIEHADIINENTIDLYSKIPLEDILKIGDKFVYYDETSAKNFYVGIVNNIEGKNNKYTISTSIPSFYDIFSKLDVSTVLNSKQVSVGFVENEEDNVVYKGIVNNDIWNSIEPVCQIPASESNDTRRLSRSGQSAPIDVTLAFEVKPNQAFTGKIYLRLEGEIYIHDKGTLEMNVNQIIGLEGSFSLASKTYERRYIPLLEIKNGITLYSNKIVGVKLKPSLNFFYSGEIKLEAGFKYEVINSNCNVKYHNGEFRNQSKDNKKDAYFRVKSLHTEAEFGLSLNGNLYAFIFSDKFFSGGVKIVSGLGVKGEKNVGIQFPDFANFDFSVSFSPLLEVTPVATLRTNTLKRYEGPTLKVNTEKFSVDLLPNIHDINYKRSATNLTVTSEIENQSSSFIQTKEDGIALFKSGDKTPVAMKSFPSSKSRGQSNNSLFEISANEDYEIARFSVSGLGETVFDERISISPDVSGIIYHRTPYEFVDLGLSVKWATSNIGAKSIGEPGYYLGWGETTQKANNIPYDAEHNIFGYPVEIGGGGRSGSQVEWHYRSIGNSICGTNYDAATKHWGGTCRMPSNKEAKELITKCRFIHGGENGLSGRWAVGPNNHAIFFPSGGFTNPTLNDVKEHHYNYRGWYWTGEISSTNYPYYAASCSLCDHYAGSFFVTSANSSLGEEYGCSERCMGINVRAVCPK